MAALLVALLAALVGQGAVARPADAAYPGKNGRIAYERWSSSGVPSIWIVKSDGTAATRLRGGHSPSWNHDGSRLVFALYDAKRGEPGAYSAGIGIVRRDGTGYVKLRSSGHAPAWSPNGKRVTFTTYNSRGDEVLHTMAATKGATPTRLGPGGWGSYHPKGGRIAFDYNGNIWTSRLDGTDRRRLTSNDPTGNVWAMAPDYSPDGARIAYEQGGSACSIKIRVMNANGSNKRTLPYKGCNMYDAAWSPSGVHILFDTEWTSVSSGSPKGMGLYRTRADGTQTTPTRIVGGDVGNASWQPRP